MHRISAFVDKTPRPAFGSVNHRCLVGLTAPPVTEKGAEGTRFFVALFEGVANAISLGSLQGIPGEVRRTACGSSRPTYARGCSGTAPNGTMTTGSPRRGNAVAFCLEQQDRGASASYRRRSRCFAVSSRSAPIPLSPRPRPDPSLTLSNSCPILHVPGLVRLVSRHGSR